jgi:hypothetical protein
MTRTKNVKEYFEYDRRFWAIIFEKAQRPTQFVGFLGAWNNPGQLPSILAATLGALVTTWTTFVPCFLWIFLGGPHIEELRGNEGNGPIRRT